MKIALGSIIQEGPWGGGNQFIINIKNYFECKGHEIFFDLKEKNLDIILMTDPRPKSSSAAFNHFDIYNYISKNPDTIIVHRINECDERKNTFGVNKNLIYANHFADYTIFISSWLKNLFSKYKNFNENNSKVILNGADYKIFNNSINKNDPTKKFKIVTHHWSSHHNKGFEYYKYLDNLLNNSDAFSKEFEFTFIGNLPKKFKFEKTNYISAKSGHELSNLLKENDVYLTASVNEPGGNHQNEGLNCGLPVLYLDSGCMKEYCEGFGLEYNKINMKDKIFEIKNRYNEFKSKVLTYNINSDSMCKKYEKLFFNLIDKKNEILKLRKDLRINFFHKLKFYLDRKML